MSFHRLAAVGLLACVAVLGAPAPHASALLDPVPVPPAADFCRPVFGEMVVCLEMPESVDPTGDSPTARACVYKDGIRLVAWWYTGTGKAACVETTHWAWLGTPSVCAGTYANGQPTACIGRDIPWDDDYDGVYEQTVHCLVWVAGSAFCFYD